MRIREITNSNALTPQKARVNNLQQAKDSATKALKAERDRQKIANAQQQIRDVQISKNLHRNN